MESLFLVIYQPPSPTILPPVYSLPNLFTFHLKYVVNGLLLIEG